MSTNSNRLTLAEELMLIALDDESGAPISLPPMALELGLAAALIGELTLEGRLDTDAEKLFVTSRAPVGDALLDEMLADVVAETRQLPSDTWLRRIAESGPVLRDRIAHRLVQRGVLKEVEKRLLWVFKTRVYPPTSGIEESGVKSRIMTLLSATRFLRRAMPCWWVFCGRQGCSMFFLVRRSTNACVVELTSWPTLRKSAGR